MPGQKPLVRRFGQISFDGMSPLADSQDGDIFVTRRGALGSNSTVTRKQIIAGGGGATEFAQAIGTSAQTLNSSVFTKLTAATTFISSADFDDDGGTAMAIRYIGAAPVTISVHYQARLASIDGSQAAMNLKLAVNGTVIDASQVSGDVDQNVTPDTGTGTFIVAVVQNDVFEMQANRNSGAQDIDIFELVLSAIKLR